MRRAPGFLIAVAAQLLVLSPLTAQAQQRVSLELVLAIDTSLSVDDHEYDLQLRGLAKAFRTPEVVELITRREGGVAVTVLQWSGIANDEDVVWRLLTDARSVAAYAGEVEKLKRWPYGYLTGVGEAILASIDQIESNAFHGRERKIDISGDGRNNTGPEPAAARIQALARGITVNGLAIQNAEVGLSEYYESEVIAGTGAFVIEASDYNDYAIAIAKKLVRELEMNVAGLPSPARFQRLPTLYVRNE